MEIVKNIYCDMDGVLADFNGEPDGVSRFRTEKGFFKNLKPLKKNVRALRKLIADGNHNVYILSASPNAAADGDKIKWLRKHRIHLADGHIILCRNGEKKVNFMKTADGILFDDFGKNLREWKVVATNEVYKITVDGTLQIGLEKLGLM